MKEKRAQGRTMSKAHSAETPKKTARFTIAPADADRWEDLVTLFGRSGACGGCWCMWWRRSSAQFKQGKGRSNKEALKRLVDSPTPPGLLAYSGSDPIGWCSFAPRCDLPRLATSRVLKPIDDKPVWSIICMFVHKDFRNQGVSTMLIRAAVRYARSQGAALLEGYPIDPAKRYVDTFAYTGLLSAFQAAGFEEVARRSATRPIVRLHARK